MIMKLSQIFRTLFVIYCLASFIAALFLSNIDFAPLLIRLTIAIGLVFFVLSSIVLQIEHHTEGRPVWELIIVLLFPILVYCLMFYFSGLSAREFWVFIGYFNAIVLTGGFIMGIFLSPIIAAFNAYSQEEILKRISLGTSSIMRKGAAGNAILLF